MLCCCSVAQSCPTLCDPMGCSMPGFPGPQHLPEFAQVHVHCIGDAIQPFHPLMPSSASALNLSQRQRLLQQVSCSHQVTKIRELQLQHQSFREYSGLMSLKIGRFDLLAAEGLSGVFSSTMVRRHQFFGILPSLWSSSHWEYHRLDYVDLCLYAWS